MEIGLKYFLDFVKFILPSVVLLAAMIYIVGGFLRDNEKREKMRIVRGNQKLITPLRLQAYERLVLFLERLSPESLLMRSPNYPNKTNDALHAELLNTIRNEFEHNLSQQLYVSPQVWNNVRNAKNFTISLINNASKEVSGEGPALQLSRKIVDMATNLEQPITEKALSEVKKEIQQLF